MGNNSRPTPPFWRSLDELVGSSQFAAWAHNEFPPDTIQAPSHVSRREMLKLAAASFVLSTLASCAKVPEQDIVPHVHAPKDRVPAKPETFATTLTRGTEAIGVIVSSYEGRPTKIEGNPRHPASLGATDAMTQAEILTLCDPDRSQAVMKGKTANTWDGATRELRERFNQDPHGVRLLSGPIVSPLILDQITRLLAKYPGLQWHVFDPLADAATATATRTAFGRDVRPVYDFSAAQTIVSFDCDFLASLPGSVRYARQFSDGRRVRSEAPTMNRLYVAECSPTITGANADHRWPASPSDLARLIESLAARLNVADASRSTRDEPWLDAVAHDLEEHRGSSLVLAGPTLPAEAQSLVLAINQRLGNVGRAVRYIESPTPPHGDLNSLIADAVVGKVDSLLVLDANPVYQSPAFRAALEGVKWKMHVGLYHDETAAECSWHVPMAHELETWGDAIAFDGTISPQQPLIAPLYGGHAPAQVLSVLLEDPLSSTYDLLTNYWRSRHKEPDFDAWWQRSLRDGVMADLPAPAPLPLAQAPTTIPTTAPSTRPARAKSLQAVFRASPHTLDGRYANNGWLQELPETITKLTWDNAAWFSPATAERLGITNETVVNVRVGGATVAAPAWIVPGQDDDTVTLPLGYGRWRAGSIGSFVGFNAFGVREAANGWGGADCSIEVTTRKHPLASTQEHSTMEGRDIVRTATLAELKSSAGEKRTVHLSLYPSGEHLKAPQQWGMSIDLTACIGCNACTIACQSENNIPSVGKAEVMRGRTMHWIRVDRYFEGDAHNPAIHHQPVPCMHCEAAPCEPVCPVGATQHSEDGLNEMVYNRCVGTRYCSNNCPYKVRRFNFLQYVDVEHESLFVHRNPEVTVRSRGVMEKCTYCVQRIRNKQIEFDIDPKNPGQPVPDGAIQTACQQVCPTQAIIFGDVNDANTQVSKLKGLSHNYGLLEELGTKPRTTYLANIRNPNPAIRTEATS